MRWLAFALIAAVTICFQTTVVPLMGIHRVYPDFMLILLVHYALHARDNDGLIAGWLLGVLVDLSSVERLGVVATAYGLTALVIWSVRDLMFTKHPLTHFSATGLSCVVIQFVLQSVFEIVHGAGTPWYQLATVSLLSGIYTGLCAVGIHYLLLRVSRSLGLQRPKHDIFATPANPGRIRVV